MPVDVELSEIRDFLAQHEPFDSLPDAVLDELPARMTVEYFRRGSKLIARGRDNHHLYVLRSGAADVHDSSGSLVGRGGAGACFGSTTIIQGNPSTFDVTAIEDCLALLLPAADFRLLCAQHPDVDAFFDAQRASRMRGAVESLQLSASGNPILKTRVRDLLTRDPVVVGTAVTVREAAEVMAREGVSSLLVMDSERLTGILTDRDLRTRVLAAGVDPGVAVTEVMTADPVTADVDSLAFEVLLEMVSRHIHHLPVVDATRPAGRRSCRPLTCSASSRRTRSTSRATSPSRRTSRAWPACRAGSRTSCSCSWSRTPRPTTSGGSSRRSGMPWSVASSRSPRPTSGAPPVPYCWVALGSRARLEQALAADQDNAIIVDDAVTPDQLAWFEELARG